MAFGRAWRCVGVLLAAGLTLGFTPPKDSRRYASLSRGEVFMRAGPSFEHKVMWVYRRAGLPVQIVAQYDIWRRVRDSEGVTGWMQGSMLSSERTVVVNTKKPVPLRDNRQPDSRISTYVAPGVVARVHNCIPQACEIVAKGAIGWIAKSAVWGVEPNETF